jgi:hypothetical protein
MAISKLNPSAGGIPFGDTAGRPANPGTGRLYSNGETARLELMTAAGSWENIVQEVPGVSGISGTYSESANSGTITINGTNFVSGAIASATGTNAVEIQASSTTFNSLVQLTAVFTGLSNANEPYDIKVTNPSNLFGMLTDALYVNASPVWVTSAGSLGTFAEQVNATIYALSVSDDSAITYSLASGSSLPSGVTLSSSGVISGTLPDIASNTTYTFTVNATDGVNTAISRTFSFISNAAPVWVTSAGSLGGYLTNTAISTPELSATDSSDTVTYALASGSSLPAGFTLNSATGVISGTLPIVYADTTYTFTINATDSINSVPREFSILNRAPVSVEYLAIGGGGAGGTNHGPGGGAGGVLSGTVSLNPSASYAISIGTGGIINSNGAQGGDGVSTTAFGLTAGGGGGGGKGYSSTGSDANGRSGVATNGSGGGGGALAIGGGGNGAGFSGGNGTGVSPGAGGGGGGAGASGSPATGSGSGGATGGAGGIGVSNSITGTATYYGGGGGGGGWTTTGANGGSGGGGKAGNPGSTGQSGAANTGGGGGGGGDGGGSAGPGGSGVLIIAYPDSESAIATIPGTLTYDQPTRAGFRVYRFTAGTGTVTF